jgi:hypothetical protein
MRLNRLGVKIIAVFGLVGLAMIGLASFVLHNSFIGIPAAIVLGLMGIAYVLSALAAIVVAIRARRKIDHNRWLAEHGLRGRVTIVEASTAMSVNEQPVFELVVDVEIPGQEQRRVERRLIVGSFAARRMRPGMVLPAYVDPRDPDDLLIVW